MARYWILLFGLAALLLSTLDLGLERNGDGPSFAPLNDGPALLMENAEITEFSLAGSPRFALRARSIAHQPSSGETALDAPILLLFNEQGAPWRLEADEGRLEGSEALLKAPDSAVANSDKVLLTGNVRAARPREDGTVLRFRTDTLSLFPAAQYAESAAPVMIESAEGITQAEGLSLALGVGFLTLGRAKARVHSTFYPDSLP
jgi:lipopolysaccharide export system protein LptC